MTISFQSSVIFVEDIDRSRRFYEGLLGQKVEMDFGPNVGFEGGFALWEVEHATQIIFGDAVGKQNKLKRGGCEIYFETDDLDAVWAAIQQAKVPLVHPMCEQPWGQRVFRVYDPDGTIVELGEPMSAVIRRLVAGGQSMP